MPASSSRFLRIAVVLATVLVSTIHLAGRTPSAGWKALALNDLETAETAFTEALRADPADGQAASGLARVRALRMDYLGAWRALDQGLDHMADRTNVLYATMSTSPVSSAVAARDERVRARLKAVVDRPDPSGTLAAMAATNLATMAELSGDLDEARSWYSRLGALVQWRMIGPFDNISASGFDRAFPPETEDRPDMVYDGASGARIRWFEPPTSRIDHWIDMTRHFPTINGMFYAVAYVRSPNTQRVSIRIGTSGAFKLFVNGTVVHSAFDEHNNDLDTYVSRITIQEGWNKVLVKLGVSELERCNFLLRITDDAGVPIPGLEVSTQPRTVKPSDVRAEVVPNPFIAGLRSRLQADPQDLESYLLLAEAYLRNDEASEAELVLWQADTVFPDNLLVMNLLLEAYSRSDKNDERSALAETMASMAPDLPASVLYRLVEAISAERIDDAEPLAARVQELLPGSTTAYDVAFSIARQRNRLNDVNRIIEEAFARHPESYSFALARAGMALQSPARYQGAIAIVEEHLHAQWSTAGMMLLANLYRESGNMAQWESMFNTIMEWEPAATGYLVTRSGTYASLNDYDKALTYVQQALEIAPAVSSLWVKAGTYQKARGDGDAAQAAFRRALECDPADFDAREALRELTGAPSPFSVMPSSNIDSLIAVAPSSVDFPEASAIYLLDDVRRVVYDGSRCELLGEMLVRILTKDGIDDFKETSVPYSGDGSFIVEKAIVRKANGKDIPADRSGEALVFKTLEVGDFVYVRYRAREARGGRMAQYFWESVSMNGYNPCMFTRLSLLVPETTTFSWKAYNGDIEPTVSTTPLGKLYVWQQGAQEAIEYEEGMPGYSDVANVIRVSSVPSWKEIVDWYYDIARTKTRTSFEITRLMDSLAPKDAHLGRNGIIDRVYRYVTSEIRYSSVPFRQSGIVPQKARTVLTTRIGDCKDVATLCIAMLAERGIEAYHVLVQTNTSPLQPDPLPTIRAFDHCIVAVVTGRSLLYMDLTADDLPIGSVPFADVDGFALLIKPGTTQPFRLTKDLFAPNNVDVKTTVRLALDNTATIEQTFTHTGARTQLYRSAWKTNSDRETAKQLSEMLSNDYADVTLDTFSVGDLDTLSQTLTFTMAFTVPNYVIEAADVRIFRIPWYSEFHPDGALSYERREHAYDFVTYKDTVRETVSIVMPAGFEPQGLRPLVSHRHDVAEYQVRSDVHGQTLDLTRLNVYYRSYVKPDEYLSYKSFYNSLVKEDRRHVLLRPVVAAGRKGRR